jgi:hypothetical protein
MHTIASRRLSVEILDPVADRARLGSRYCTGGYVYQVRDQAGGPLLTGPQWPAENPNPFHGQGAPEAFALYPGADQTLVGGVVGVMGVGLVRRDSAETPFQPRHNPAVVEFASWDVAVSDSEVRMTTEHGCAEWRCGLERSVTVNENTITSHTVLRNIGTLPAPFRWFAHPFFPIPAGRRLFRSNLALTIDESDGFLQDAAGWFCRRDEHDWSEGCFCELGYDPRDGVPVDLIQVHPAGSIRVRTDFVPVRFPIWGNDRTFSVEPYHGGHLEAGYTTAWTIRYTFES